MKRMLAPLVVLGLAVNWAAAGTHPTGVLLSRSGQPSNVFVQTNALEAELLQSMQRIQASAARLSRAKQLAETTRSAVQQAISVVRTIDEFDDQLIRLIRQLEPISKLPPTKALRPLVTNLQRVQSQVHSLRLKADRARQQVLQPLANRLISLERMLTQAIQGCTGAAAQTAQAREHIRDLRDFVQGRGNPALAVASLEALARETRAGLQPLRDGLTALDNAGANAERDLAALTRQLTPFNATGASLQRQRQKLTPVDKAARDLDKVLSHRLQVKVFAKTYGFSIRQIIEKPGQILDIVLKPLEKLAEQALRPVLRALKLEVQPPRELAELSRGLDNLNASGARLTQTLARLEQPLRSTYLRSFQTALANLVAKQATSLANSR